MTNPLHVLVVEDSRCDAAVLAHHLERAGYEIQWERVESAAELNAALDQKAWDLILCDYWMPSFTGLDALAIVRGRKLEVPFIIVSGTIGEEAAVDALKSGAHDYVMKGGLERLVPAIERELREAALRRERQQKDRLLALNTSALQATANAIAITHRNGTIQWVNRAFTTLTGYSASEVIGQNPRLLKSGRHSAEYYRDLWNTILAGEVWHGEMINRRKDGSLYSEEQTITPFRTENGEVTHFVSIKQDITARKLAEAKLQQQAEALAASNADLQQFNRLAVGRERRVVELKAEVNELCVRLGQPGRHNLSMTEPLPPEIEPAAPAAFPIALEATNRRILVVDDNPSIHEDFRKILGASRWTRETGINLFDEKEEEPAYFEVDCAATGEDALALAQQAAAEGKPYGLAFVDVRMAPGWDGVETASQIWEKHPDIQIILCTAYSDYSWPEMRRRLAGRPDQLLILKKPLDVMEVSHFAHAMLEKWRRGQDAKRKLSGLEDAVLERTREIEDSRTAALNMMADAVEARNALERTNRDLEKQILERERMEQVLRQAQKMEAVGQLAGGIAHDFNNLLVVINGYSNLLLDSGQLSGPDAETLKQVYLAGERAAHLTRQLLMFSRKQAVQMEVTDLSRVVNGVSKMLQRVIGEDIELQVTTPEVPASIMADEGMMEQILMNLAVNARDAMPKGGQLTIRLATEEISPSAPKKHPKARPGPFVCLSVTDTGCGMSPEVTAHVFEPFFTTKPVGKGTGMGLATVFGIVEQHQGWIEVETVVNAGTTFTVFLPLASPAAVTARVVKELKPAAGGNEFILVVEDEESVRSLAVIVLKKYGYRVLEAASGPEALEVWDRHGPKIDLLITDMVMPGDMTGRELTDTLRASKPGLKVIYSSGYSSEMMSQSLGQMPNVPFLQKPYTPTRLAEAVRQALDENSDTSAPPDFSPSPPADGGEGRGEEVPLTWSF